MVSFASTFPPVAEKASLIATIALFTTTVAVSCTSLMVLLLLHNLICDGYVPLGVFGATVKFPSISILNGPFVTGVTSVLAVVACIPLTVSFSITFCCWEGIVIGSN
jgi:hypothetical protein